MREEYRAFRVSSFVHDRELEDVLNEPGWALVKLFRNSPGSDGQETTTVVQIRDEVEECFGKLMEEAETYSITL